MVVAKPRSNVLLLTLALLSALASAEDHEWISSRPSVVEFVDQGDPSQDLTDATTLWEGKVTTLTSQHEQAVTDMETAHATALAAEDGQPQDTIDALQQTQTDELDTVRSEQATAMQTLVGEKDAALTPLQEAVNESNGGEEAESEEVTDCSVTEWSEFSECNKECGSGEQSRSRTVETPAANGGTACPELEESRECNTQACVDEEPAEQAETVIPEWGYLIQNSDVATCPSGYAQAASLKAEALLESGWDGSAICSGESPDVPSGVGYLLQDDSRDACTSGFDFVGLIDGSFLEESIWDSATICQGVAQVPTDTEYGYLLKGLDKEGCRPGFVFVGWLKAEAMGPGEWDGASICYGKPQVDCTLGQWSEYGSCSKECGGGEQSRSREVERESANGGAACGDTTEQRQCNTEGCSANQEENDMDGEQEQQQEQNAIDEQTETPAQRAAAKAKKEALEEQVALALHGKEQAQQAYDSVKTTYDEVATQARQSRSSADQSADKAAKSQITHDDQKVIYDKAKKTYEDLKAKAEAAATSLAEATAAHEQADSTVLAQKAAADEAVVTVKAASEKQVAALGRDKEDAAKALDKIWQDAKKSVGSKQVILSSAQDEAQKTKNTLAGENRASLAAEAADKQAQQARADAAKDVADQVGAKIDAAEKAEQLKLAVNTLEAELKTAEERASTAAAAVTEHKNLLSTRVTELSAADNAHAKAKDALQTAEMHLPRAKQAVDTAKALLDQATQKLEEVTKKHDAAVTELGAHTKTLDKLGGDGAGKIGLAKNFLAGREAVKHMAQQALKTAEAAQVPVAAAKERAATDAAAAVVAATKSAEEALAKAAAVAQEQKNLEREQTSGLKNVQATLPKKIEDMGSSMESETGKSERAAGKVAQLTSEIEANEMTNHQNKLAVSEATVEQSAAEMAVKDQEAVFKAANDPSIAAAEVFKAETKGLSDAEMAKTDAERAAEAATDASNEAAAARTAADAAEKDSITNWESKNAREVAADGDYQSAAGALLGAHEDAAAKTENLETATEAKSTANQKLDETTAALSAAQTFWQKNTVAVETGGKNQQEAKMLVQQLESTADDSSTKLESLEATMKGAIEFSASKAIAVGTQALKVTRGEEDAGAADKDLMAVEAVLSAKEEKVRTTEKDIEKIKKLLKIAEGKLEEETDTAASLKTVYQKAKTHEVDVKLKMNEASAAKSRTQEAADASEVTASHLKARSEVKEIGAKHAKADAEDAQGASDKTDKTLADATEKHSAASDQQRAATQKQLELNSALQQVELELETSVRQEKKAKESVQGAEKAATQACVSHAAAVEAAALDAEKKLKFETEQQVNEIRRKTSETTQAVLKAAHDETDGLELEWRSKLEDVTQQEEMAAIKKAASTKARRTKLAGLEQAEAIKSAADEEINNMDPTVLLQKAEDGSTEQEASDFCTAAHTKAKQAGADVLAAEQTTLAIRKRVAEARSAIVEQASIVGTLKSATAELQADRDRAKASADQKRKITDHTTSHSDSLQEASAALKVKLIEATALHEREKTAASTAADEVVSLQDKMLKADSAVVQARAAWDDAVNVETEAKVPVDEYGKKLKAAEEDLESTKIAVGQSETSVRHGRNVVKTAKDILQRVQAQLVKIESEMKVANKDETKATEKVAEQTASHQKRRQELLAAKEALTVAIDNLRASEIAADTEKDTVKLATDANRQAEKEVRAPDQAYTDAVAAARITDTALTNAEKTATDTGAELGVQTKAAQEAEQSMNDAIKAHKNAANSQMDAETALLKAKALLESKSNAETVQSDVKTAAEKDADEKEVAAKAADAELKVLQQVVNAKKLAVIEKTKVVERVQAEQIRLAKSQSKASSNKEGADAALQAATEKKASIEQELVEAQTALTLLETELAAKKTATEAATALAAQAHTNIKTIEEQVVAASKDINDAFDAGVSSIEKKKEELEATEKPIVEASDELTALQSKKATATKAGEGASSNLKELEVAVDAAKAALATAKATKEAKESDKEDAKDEVTVKKAALSALEAPFDAAKTAQSEQEASTENAETVQATTKAALTKAEADLSKQQQAERAAAASSKATNEKQATLESDEAEATKVAAEAKATFDTAKAKVAESTASLELAEKTLADAQNDHSEKEFAAEKAEDSYNVANKEAQHVVTVRLPAAKNEVTQAKQAAGASENLAKQEASELRTVASKAKSALTPIQIEESGAFKENTEQHKSFKMLERALSSANLQAELAKRKRTFDEKLAEKQAARVDAATQLLTDAKSRYMTSEQELEKLGIGEVAELGA